MKNREGKGDVKREGMKIKMWEVFRVIRMQRGRTEMISSDGDRGGGGEGAAVMNSSVQKLECSCSPLRTEPLIPQIFMHQAK